MCTLYEEFNKIPVTVLWMRTRRVCVYVSPRNGSSVNVLAASYICDRPIDPYSHDGKLFSHVSLIAD